MFPDRNKQTKNFTMVSNILIEEVFPKLSSMAECKIILHIYRNTVGVVTGVDDEGNTTFRKYYFATVRRIAEDLGLTHQSVITGLAKLVKGGYIVKEVRDGKTGYGLKFQDEEPTQESLPDLPKNLG